MDDPDVQKWAKVVEGRMYEVLRGSNAYRMLERCYDNLGLYGTFGAMIVADFENIIHCHSFPMGRYRIAVGDKGRVEYLHRDIPMTRANVVEMFGRENCSPELLRSFDANRLHEKVTICHAVEKRVDRDPMSPLSTDKPYASFYWEKGKQSFLQVSGFGINPLLVPRWHSVEDEPFSVTCPAMEALGDAVQLQGQHRDKAIAIKKSYDPPLVSGANSSAVMYRNVPGGITTTQTSDLRTGGLRSIYDVQTRIDHLMMDISDTQGRIKSAFFTDLFLMTSGSDRRQVTAREIAERHEEKLLVLGPVLEALDHDLLQPLIQATFFHMQEADALPPAPESIGGRPIKVEYISALAQAQKAVGVAPMERTIGFAASLEQMIPGTMDNIDGDIALREFSKQVGGNPTMMADPDDVAAKRKARAEQAQQAEMMQNAQPLAQAASLVSEMSERGAEGIQRGAPL